MSGIDSEIEFSEIDTTQVMFIAEGYGTIAKPPTDCLGLSGSRDTEAKNGCDYKNCSLHFFSIM